MRNFNTNQTRHFYVGKVAESGDGSVNIGLIEDKDSKIVSGLYFKGVNADGLAYRSDVVDPKKIVSVKLTPGSKLNFKLLQHTIAVNTAKFANVAALAGKTVKLTVTVHQVFDYDDSNSTAFTVQHTVASGETAANFYAALAKAVEKAMPKPDKKYPYFTVTSSANGLVLTEALQKYVRGKLTGEPVHISVAFGIAAASYTDDEYVAWGADTVTATDGGCANYVLADLEYFAYGERGDYYRGNNWPNNIEPTYVIDPKGDTEYDVLTVEYYWNGGAENIQKSPRLIQVAAPTGTLADIKSQIDNIVATGKKSAEASADTDGGD